MIFVGVLYLICGLAMAYGLRAYVNAVAREQEDVPTFEDTQNEMLRSPRNLPKIVLRRTRQYIRLLAQRQSDPDIEIRRRFALFAVGVSIAVFVLIAVS